MAVQQTEVSPTSEFEACSESCSEILTPPAPRALLPPFWTMRPLGDCDMPMRTASRVALGALLLLPLYTMAAHAHHPTGGLMPTSFLHGFLSGIGHPLLGADHFAFVIGIGLLAAIGGFGLALPVLFVVAMVAGLGMHLVGLNVPYAEVLLPLSVLGIGLAVARGPDHRLHKLGAGLFAVAGVLHGFAFAETVIGAEPAPIVAYVVGLAVIQMTIAAVAWQVSRVSPGTSPMMRPAYVRAMGFAIAAVGGVFLALNVGTMT